jgi:hypothetical protein
VARAEAGLSAIEAVSSEGGPSGEATEASTGPEEAVGEEGYRPSVTKQLSEKLINKMFNSYPSVIILPVT